MWSDSVSKWCALWIQWTVGMKDSLHKLCLISRFSQGREAKPHCSNVLWRKVWLKCIFQSMLKKISARSVLLVLRILKNWHKNKALHSYWPVGCVWFAAFEGCHRHHCPTGDVDSILAAAAFGPECSQEPGPAGRCCPQTETSGSALQPIPGRPNILQKETTLFSLTDTLVIEM